MDVSTPHAQPGDDVSLLAFPLGMPLGGVAVSNLRVRRRAGSPNSILLDWTPISLPWPSAYMVAVDGKRHSIISHEPPAVVRVDETGGTPIIEVAQIPMTAADPGYFVPGYFTAVLPNKIRFPFTPPADRTGVLKYRIYWDKGEGTVKYTDAYLLGEVLENGLAAYEIWTPPIATGTYKFVVRSVDEAGNEDSNTTTASTSLVTYPGVISGLSLTYDDDTHKATLTWADPSDIGAGSVKIYGNGGSESIPYADYSAPIDTVAAGVEEWESPELSAGTYWIFGLRVNDGTNEELNTDVLAVVRIGSAQEVIGSPPPKPILVASAGGGGSVMLTAYLLNTGEVAKKVNFYVNNGAGGAVDYGTPIGSISVVNAGVLDAAMLTTTPFSEVEYIFGAKAENATGDEGFAAVEIKLTPDATAPDAPTAGAPTTGRD